MQAVLSVLFFGGLILTVVEINLYRDTVISATLVVGLWLASGLVMTPLTSGLLSKYYDTHNVFLKVVYNVATFGGIVVYTFVGLNFYFPENDPMTVSAKIIKTGTLAKGRYGCGNPYVHVELNGQIKELVLPCDFDVEGYKVADLTTVRGMLGFDIITDVHLVRR